jgi:hypothetical protein
MVRKPPGMVAMSYIYELTNNTVTEYDGVTYESIENWHMDSLRANIFKNFGEDSNNKLKHIAKSYLRTREWTLKNHPELML